MTEPLYTEATMRAAIAAVEADAMSKCLAVVEAYAAEQNIQKKNNRNALARHHAAEAIAKRVRALRAAPNQQGVEP